MVRYFFRNYNKKNKIDFVKNYIACWVYSYTPANSCLKNRNYDYKTVNQIKKKLMD